MDIVSIKEWLSLISTVGVAIAAICGGWITLTEYRLKIKAETRLLEATKIESDVKLLNLFTEIMNIAHARGTSVLVSEKIFEARLEAQNTKNVDNASYVTFGVGTACQDAAIVAIGELGKKHDLLRPSALRALETLAEIKPEIVKPVLDKLKKSSVGRE